MDVGKHKKDSNSVSSPGTELNCDVAAAESYSEQAMVIMITPD